MKKLLFVLGIAGFLLARTQCNAAEISSSFDRTFIGNYHYVDQNGRFGDFELFKRREDGRIAYCIEPGVSFSSSEYQGAYDLTNQELANRVGITEKQLQRISLIAYFAYGYGDHNNSEWIVAAQAKIWDILGRQYQFTSRNSSANPWAYVIPTPPEIQEKMDALDRFITMYNTLPPISGSELVIPVGETYSLATNPLSFYQIQGNHPEVSLIGNVLSISPKEEGETTVTLKQNLDIYSSPFIVYYHNDSQNLFLTGNIPNRELSFSYKAVTGRAEIIKLDKDTNSCFSSSGKVMGDAIYGLYKTDGTLVQKVTVSNCKGTAEHLTVGEYYWQEIEAPYGYLLDTQKYYFDLKYHEILNTSVTQVYDEEDIKKIIIHKEYLKENETLMPEEGVKFEIIDKNLDQVVATLVTDENGFASTMLHYGTYLIRQVSGTSGYQFIEEQEFVVNEDSQNEMTYSFVNKPYLKDIKVLKKDNSLKNPILQAGIQFKLYDTINKKYICRNEECTFETNEYGELIITDLYYSTYRLEEIDQDFNGYLWNQEPLEFIVDENSSDEILLEFFNQPVQGAIEIYKTTEEGTPLQDVVFQIFAKEDIFQNQVLLYHKDELVAEIVTDKDGKATLIGLPLGTYVVKEIRPLDGYEIDTNSYDIVFQYEDNVTPVVYGNLNLVNYKVPETKKNRSWIPFHILFLGLGYFIYEKRYFYL